jgi:hypothetical protein
MLRARAKDMKPGSYKNFGQKAFMRWLVVNFSRLPLVSLCKSAGKAEPIPQIGKKFRGSNLMG